MSSVAHEGHINGGRVSRVATTQIRSILGSSMPFVNFDTWSITVGK